jgi:hypothetical protein
MFPALQNTVRSEGVIALQPSLTLSMPLEETKKAEIAR